MAPGFYGPNYLSLNGVPRNRAEYGFRGPPSLACPSSAALVDSSPALQRPSKVAIALVPVLAFIGAAVNYSRAVQARTSLQVALDSAALMVSKDLTNGILSGSEIESEAKS